MRVGVRVRVRVRVGARVTVRVRVGARVRVRVRVRVRLVSHLRHMFVMRRGCSHLKRST